MPSLTVKIEWDEPRRKGWLTVQQVQHCLNGICGNNMFRVVDAGSTGIEDVSLRVSGKDIPLEDVIAIASKRP